MKKVFPGITIQQIMYVSSVTYKDWRNIEDASVSFGGGINVLWGMNAQGKSNILEGLYYFARGRSFRGAKDRELIRFGADFASAGISYRRDGFEHDTELSALIPKNGKKKLTRNGAPLSSSAEMMGSFRAVLFSPANLSLVSGGPGERRTFLDVALSQLSGAYLTYLRRYSKILNERNALIKSINEGRCCSAEEWDVYASAMAECGTWIAAYRREYAEYLETSVRRYFAEMTAGQEIPELRYRSHGLYDGIPSPMKESKEPDTKELYERLISNRERECAAGVSLYGIHKDDIELTLNGREAKLYASQGQQRSFALSMKLAEAEISKKLGGEYPAVLLDDVFSELDEKRRDYILSSLGSGDERQIIITSCEPDVIPGTKAADVTFRHVENGSVTE